MSDQQKVPPTSPTALDMLRESHEAALRHALDAGQRYLKGEATAEEVTQSGRDLDVTSDLLEKGVYPQEEGAMEKRTDIEVLTDGRDALDSQVKEVESRWVDGRATEEEMSDTEELRDNAQHILDQAQRSDREGGS